ncbi:MAG: ABC-type transport system involved in Fe-S cluster assembly, permease component [Phenylobacterium sp.]|uniref:Fe-S cluster assembly protein SufD n=1 Tax=Phenylobacterium sp. TaxID=1871053 RepID=UPI00261CD6BD|nr:Fe-S cluster assembly protein SufD [Phenylobacterium sp.]MDB5463520.1 ABC-type transport system involved in Fe-S cluster assembly, permease component [Phenylobacterium sp.]MDB5499983.1 ABC-type transport system involved in Fe-S cluster assembly, permease component [Phenylobacterium sp.]
MSLTAAIRDRDVAELPGKRDEAWRWTDLRGLIRKLPPPSEPFVGDVGDGPFDALARDRRVIVNGRGAEPIEIARGSTAVVAARFVSQGAGVHVARLNIIVGADARLQLLESYESDGGSVSQAVLTITLGKGAAIERVVLAQDNAEAISVSQATVTLAPRARFAQTVVASGARRQRIETRVQHPGGHAELRLDGVYLLADKRHSDQTTVVTHESTDGTTVQLTKGVVRDQARGIFQGRIVVEEGADRTDARMGHHALILSDRAEVDAKPELEIYADDVACAHGNTVGALDEDALFYARQRGMPEADARAMLTEAFIGEVVDRIEHEGAREVVRAWAVERLRG